MIGKYTPTLNMSCKYIPISYMLCKYTPVLYNFKTDVTQASFHTSFYNHVLMSMKFSNDIIVKTGLKTNVNLLPL